MDMQSTKTAFNLQLGIFHEARDRDVSLVIPACQLHHHTNNTMCYATATKQAMTKLMVTPMNFVCLLSPNFA
jgi:4-hydroxy-3-methylbut-2-enyl diphosphate reductase IspH